MWTFWLSNLDSQPPDRTKSKNLSLSLRSQKPIKSLSRKLKLKLSFDAKSVRKTSKASTIYTFTWRAKAIIPESLQSNGSTSSPNQRSSLLIRSRKLEKVGMRPE